MTRHAVAPGGLVVASVRRSAQGGVRGSLALQALLVLGALFEAWCVAYGHVAQGIAVVAAVPLAAFVVAEPLRALVIGIGMILLIPSSLTLGRPQLTVSRVAALAALAALALRGAARLRESQRLAAPDYALLAFVILGVAGVAFGPQPPSGYRPIVNLLVPFAFYPAARHYTGRSTELLRAVSAGGALASLSVYYEALVSHKPLYADASSYYWNSTDQYIFRPGGVFGSPPGAAAVLAMTTLCSLPLVRRTEGRRRLVWVLAIVLQVGALGLTFTRGGIFGFAAGLLTFVFLLGSRVSVRAGYALAGVVLAVALVVLPEVNGATWFQKGFLRQGTLASRQSYWADDWPLVSNTYTHLVVGHGINSLLVGRPEYPGQPPNDVAAVPSLTVKGPHNQYLRTLLEQGLVGAGLLLAWLGGACVVGVRAARRRTGSQSELAALTGAAVAFAVISLVDDTMRQPPSLACAAIVTGLLVGCAARGRVQQAEAANGAPE